MALCQWCSTRQTQSDSSSRKSFFGVKINILLDSIFFSFLLQNMSICLFAHLSVRYLSFRSSLSLYVCLTIRPSFSASVFLFICLYVCLPACLSAYLSVCPSISQSVSLSVCLSVCLSVHTSVNLSVCLSVFCPAV
jgi:hypothetical protein